MTAIVWVTDGSWRACVDAAGAWIPDHAHVELLHVTDDEAAHVVHGAFIGLLGRSRPAREDPGRRLQELSTAAAGELLAAAADRLRRPATPVQRHGRVEDQVVQAAGGADLLICARDGDPDRLGPRSLAPPTRFVVDHAPCAVLLVWPGSAPAVDTLPPPPSGPPPRP